MELFNLRVDRDTIEALDRIAELVNARREWGRPVTRSEVARDLLKAAIDSYFERERP